MDKNSLISKKENKNIAELREKGIATSRISLKELGEKKTKLLKLIMPRGQMGWRMVGFYSYSSSKY